MAFYIHCPSYVKNVYENTASSFKIILPKSFTLPNYQVALCSITYKHRWLTFTKHDKFTLEIQTKNKKPLLSLQIPNEIKTFEQIYDTFNKGISADSEIQISQMPTVEHTPTYNFIIQLENTSAKKKHLYFDSNIIRAFSIIPLDSTNDPHVLVDDDYIKDTHAYIYPYEKIFYRISAKNIITNNVSNKGYTGYIYEQDVPEKVTVNLEEKYFTKGNEMIEYIQDTTSTTLIKAGMPGIAKFIDYDEVVKIRLSETGVVGVHMHWLLPMLGFENVPTSKGVHLAQRQPHFRRGIDSMFLYSSVCQDICVGDTFAPVLAVMPLKLQESDDFTHVDFTNRVYIDTKPDTFREITFVFRDSSGEQMTETLIDKTMLLLHFRPKTSLEDPTLS